MPRGTIGKTRAQYWQEMYDVALDVLRHVVLERHKRITIAQEYAERKTGELFG